MAAKAAPLSVRILIHALAAMLLALAVSDPRLASSPRRSQESASGEQVLSPSAYVSLDAVAEEPFAWLGRPLRTVVQIHSPCESWNPLLTRYGAGDYAGVRAWADEQFLWEAEEYEQPRVLLFARHGGAAAGALAQGQRYARFEIEARVGQVFAGRPWIEVSSARRLDGAVTEGTVLHGSRALQLMEGGDFALALEDLGRALDGWPPPAARAELERLRQTCREALDLRKGRQNLASSSGGSLGGSIRGETDLR